MDRFTQELPSNLEHMMQIWGDEYEPYVEDADNGPTMTLAQCFVVNTCMNCTETAERLTASPADETFLLCDDCMEEALKVIAKEQLAKREPSTADLLYRLEDLRNARRLKDVA